MAVKNRVLIVDDEEDLTWSITKSLKRENRALDVISVNSGKEALEILQNKKVDLLITDLRMPETNGLDLINFVQNKQLDTKIIVMTAYGSQEIENQLLLCEKCYFIEKPFEMGSLKRKIFQILNTDPIKAGNQVGKKIQRLLETSKSGDELRITLVNGREKGQIYISNGQICQAELGFLNGRNALDEMLRWKHCVLEVESSEDREIVAK